MSVTLYAHQKETVDFITNHPRTFVTSTCGTGKTISILEAFNRRHLKTMAKMLVIAPKSTLHPVWAQDIGDYYPNLKCGVLDRKALKKDPEFYMTKLLSRNDIVVINIEGADLLLNHSYVFPVEGFDTLVIDEFTSIKNRTSQRSKTVGKLAKHFEYRYLLSGSPTPNGIVDIWHPALVLDDGVRLGANFFHFRGAVCQPVEKGTYQKFTEWQEIPGAADVIGDTLRDITIRHELEEVIDMPDRIYRTLTVQMPAALRKSYNAMKDNALLELENEDITGVNAAVVGNKLLQIASGSIYGEDQAGISLDSTKYELITELVAERDHSIVFYTWNHQCDEMEKQLGKQKISYEIIRGATSAVQRAQIITDYQNGKYQTLLLQPAAAAHGITLTRSTASIWCSPTYNLEHFIQANYRDYRIGQKKRSEVIMIQYEDTIEEKVYDSLQHKRKALDNLLQILKS